MIVLYRNDCEHCKDRLPSIVAQAEHDQTMRVAFIEVSSGRTAGVRILDLSDHQKVRMVMGRLDTSHDWFVETPTVIRLRDGVVLSNRLEEGSVSIASHSEKP